MDSAFTLIWAIFTEAILTEKTRWEAECLADKMILMTRIRPETEANEGLVKHQQEQFVLLSSV